VAGDTCDPTKGIDRLPTIKSCPGFFGGSAAEVSRTGWVVLIILVGLAGVLVLVTMRTRSDAAGLSFSSVLEMLPTDRTACLMCLLAIPGALVECCGFVKNAVTGFRGGGGSARYGALPDSAMDDELDLGDELVDEEAEELRDDDARLNTLPPVNTPKRTSDVGNLLGDEFTSPHAGAKKGA
jgi:hypothetical protein